METPRPFRVARLLIALTALAGANADTATAPPAHFVLRGAAAPPAGSGAVDLQALVRRAPAVEGGLQRRAETPIVLTERDDVPDVAAKPDVVAAKAKRQAGQLGVAVPGYGTVAAGGLNTSYVGLIGVGTPPQMLPVTFDLGVPLISVATNGCTSVRSRLEDVI